MTTAGKLLDKLEALDIDLLMQVAMEETASEATEAQRDQLWDGIGADDRMITPEYAEVTKSIKRGKGQPTDRVTLKDTGDFYRGIQIDVRGDIFILDSHDPKATMLDNKYRNALGLGTEAKNKYILSLYPEFMKWIISGLN